MASFSQNEQNLNILREADLKKEPRKEDRMPRVFKEKENLDTKVRFHGRFRALFFSPEATKGKLSNISIPSTARQGGQCVQGKGESQEYSQVQVRKCRASCAEPDCHLPG